MSRELRFDGCVAVVTGASRGIGAAVAETLGGLGVQLVLLSRTVGGLEAVDDKIREAGGKPALLVPLDLAELPSGKGGSGGLDQLGGHLFERFGRVDFLFGLAAMLDMLEPAAHAEPLIWTRAMAVNAIANQRLIRTLDPLLRKAPAGRAIFAACGLGAATRAYWSGYRASKAALEELALAYAAETASTSLRVNLVDPGRVGTRLHKAAFPGLEPESLTSPAESAAWFVNALNSNETGQIFRHG